MFFSRLLILMFSLLSLVCMPWLWDGKSKASSLINILNEVIGSDPIFSQLLALLRNQTLLLDFGQHYEFRMLWDR